MEIAFGFDEKYVMPGGVLIASILKTHPDTAINFHILSESISEESKRLLKATVQTAPATQLHFYSITDWKAKTRMPEAFHFTVAIYYKLFIASLLPVSVSKVLYLDSDMLVVDSLLELWETDLGNYAAAMSVDLHHDDIRDFNRLNYEMYNGYYNSGMCLLNLDLWRAENLPEKILSYIVANKAHCKFYDQDAINYVLRGRIRRVSFRYNMQDFYAIEDVTVRQSLHEDLLAARDHPAIVHFVGGVKPWHIESRHPYRDLWRHVQKMTRWAGHRLEPAFSKTDRYAALRWAKRMLRAAFAGADRAPVYISVHLDEVFRRF